MHKSLFSSQSQSHAYVPMQEKVRASIKHQQTKQQILAKTIAQKQKMQQLFTEKQLQQRSLNKLKILQTPIS